MLGITLCFVEKHPHREMEPSQYYDGSTVDVILIKSCINQPATHSRSPYSEQSYFPGSGLQKYVQSAP